jgi:hypothetical protein
LGLDRYYSTPAKTVFRSGAIRDEDDILINIGSKGRGDFRCRLCKGRRAEGALKTVEGEKGVESGDVVMRESDVGRMQKEPAGAAANKGIARVEGSVDSGNESKLGTGVEVGEAKTAST